MINYLSSPRTCLRSGASRGGRRGRGAASTAVAVLASILFSSRPGAGVVSATAKPNELAAAHESQNEEPPATIINDALHTVGLGGGQLRGVGHGHVMSGRAASAFRSGSNTTNNTPGIATSERALANCRDSGYEFEYKNEDGRRITTDCRDMAREVGYNGNVFANKQRARKLRRKCERSLTGDDSKDEVKDVCPETCGECGGGSSSSSSGGRLGRHVVDRVDSQARCSPPKRHDPDTAVLLAVTTREIFIGCRSFEEYLSPDFRTVFILNEAVADEWDLDNLVRDAPCSKSLGATLLTLNNYGGEIAGRKLALDFVEDEAPKTQFLMQMNCDVHALPRGHKYHRSVRESVTKAAEDFHLARSQREPRKYDADDVPKFNLVDNLKDDDPLLDDPIFGMSFILLEDFDNDRDLTSHFHGVDGCKWVKDGGRDDRPDRQFGDNPWLCTGERWENHALMFDMDKLEDVRDFYVDTPYEDGLQSFPSDTRFGPRFSREYGMTMVTNRDVYFHQDFAQEGSDTLDKYDSRVDRDTIRVLSWAALGETRGPSMPYRAYNAYEDIDLPPYIGGTGIKFAARHVLTKRSPWIPRDLEGMEINDDRLARIMLDGMMSLFGYERFDESDDDYVKYRIAGVYPGNNYVIASEDRIDCRDCWEFMRIKVKKSGEIIRLVAVAEVTMREIRYMDPSDRIIELPAKASIDEFMGPSEIEGKDTIHEKGVHRRGGSTPCGAPDQKVKRACGYRDSPRFDKSYRD